MNFWALKSHMLYENQAKMKEKIAGYVKVFNDNAEKFFSKQRSCKK